MRMCKTLDNLGQRKKKKDSFWCIWLRFESDKDNGFISQKLHRDNKWNIVF